MEGQWTAVSIRVDHAPPPTPLTLALRAVMSDGTSVDASLVVVGVGARANDDLFKAREALPLGRGVERSQLTTRAARS